MEKFLSYESFLQEELSTVGNVNGMGDVSTPGNGEGSGDTWPSLFKPFTLAQFKRKRRKKKKTKYPVSLVPSKHQIDEK